MPQCTTYLLYAETITPYYTGFISENIGIRLLIQLGNQ